MSYLLSATILLFAVWPAYYVLLRYSERYTVNRCLLLLAMIAACALPFVSFTSPAPVVTQTVRGTIDFVSGSTAQASVVVPDAALNVSPSPAETSYQTTAEPIVALPTWTMIYGFGVALLLLVMATRLAVLLTLHLRSRPNGDGTYQLLHPGAKSGQAFTFGRRIYFSIDVPDAEDFDHILAHERVHARQGHSLDILLTELFLCAFWFHPAAWWLRSKTRANLEYLVDRAVLDAGSDRRSYQLALVRQSQSAHGLALTLPFSEPSLKSRISRMTGMPEYRVVAGLAAVALLFWLGVSLLVINGRITDNFSDGLPPEGNDYLAAAVGPDDLFFEHYAATLPDELYSFELYTRRMLTGNEYLQLRAIVSQFPGAKLYVHRQPFDEGYNLELQMKGTKPAVAYPLNEAPGEGLFMMGLEKNAGTGEFTPVAMVRKPDAQTFDGEGSLTFFTTGRPGNTELIKSLEHPGFKHDVTVYVNGTFIDLLKKPYVTIHNNGDEKTEVSVAINGEPVTLTETLDLLTSVNGVSLTDLPADAWHEVRVEGRQLPLPKDRLITLLGGAKPVGPAFSTQSVRYDGGTYRSWYEALRWPADREEVYYYNDRQVTLDFLLDTDFGWNSMIQSGVIYDTPQGRYVLQLIDDTSLDQPQSNLNYGIPPSEVDTDRPEEVTLYFHRLPTLWEAEVVRLYLASFPDLEFTVYQDCQYANGNYSFGVSTKAGNTNSFSNVSVGEVFEQPLAFTIKRHGEGAKVSTVNPEEVILPDGAPAQEVFLNVDGVWVTYGYTDQSTYSRATLDPVPASVSLHCLLFGDLVERSGKPVWRATATNMDKAFEELLKLAEEEGLNNRPLTFYVNDMPVDVGEFSNFKGGPDAYMQIGAEMGGVATSVVLQIIDPAAR